LFFNNFLTDAKFKVFPTEPIAKRKPDENGVERTNKRLGKNGKTDKIDEELFVRKVRFGRALRSVEAALGLTDQGHVFTGFGADTDVVSLVAKGLVWKDSISPNHGEYTHRLQWLAVAFGVMGFDGKKFLAAYTGSAKHSATMKDSGGKDRTVYLW